MISKINITQPRRFISKWREKFSLRKAEINPSNVLLGGENWIPASRYSSATGNLLRPSTTISNGPHYKLLEQYKELGDKIFEQIEFEQTEYYKNAIDCIELFGNYFSARNAAEISIIAKRFAESFSGKYRYSWSEDKLHSPENAPINVVQIYGSSCYQILDGHHRSAGYTFTGQQSLPVTISPGSVKTPAQELLLNVLWQDGRNELYQPIDLPEVSSWRLVRNCSDRFDMMINFLGDFRAGKSISSYADLGASYGWFVKNMKDREFNSVGIERDPASIRVGNVIYGLFPEDSIQSSLERFLYSTSSSYDVVSLFSVLHHFVLGRSHMSADDLIRRVDQITKHVLFLDTGQSHEEWFRESLADWTPEYIENWILSRTSFSKVISLGVDRDSIGDFESNYGRTLFACIR